MILADHKSGLGRTPFRVVLIKTEMSDGQCWDVNDWTREKWTNQPGFF